MGCVFVLSREPSQGWFSNPAQGYTELFLLFFFPQVISGQPVYFYHLSYMENSSENEHTKVSSNPVFLIR